MHTLCRPRYHDIVLNGQHTQAGGQLDEYRNDPEWCNFYWTSKDNPQPERFVQKTAFQHRQLFGLPLFNI
ncbi:hypothetical protein C7R93_13440 [Brevibacillus fortis]|uniref:Uncharacterized protein n=1 Tax=Brevibacillus fortis TaxID=2126352 RepID=A0A2P7V727_9BACL|nr:hypothetical protein C7R93_13440 [Brevibacillus fortis]